MKTVFALALLIVCVGPCFAGQPPGFAHLASPPAQDRSLVLSLWYPTADAGQGMEVGGNAVFKGALAVPDGPAAAGVFPLVLVEHGGLRSADDSGAWLCAALVRAGFVAVEINGPRTENATNAVDEIWRRPEDISRALDLLMASPNWAGHIDKSRVSVVGYGLGGTAALAVAGGWFDAGRYMRACEDGAAPRQDCAWYAAQHVSLALVDRAQLVAPRFDPRIVSVVAIAPEYLGVFVQGRALVDLPTLAVQLGAANRIEQGVRGPSVQRVTIPDASMADGLPVCTETGPGILAREGGEAGICGTSADARERVHEELAAGITDFLKGGP